MIDCFISNDANLSVVVVAVDGTDTHLLSETNIGICTCRSVYFHHHQKAAKGCSHTNPRHFSFSCSFETRRVGPGYPLVLEARLISFDSRTLGPFIIFSSFPVEQVSSVPNGSLPREVRKMSWF